MKTQQDYIKEFPGLDINLLVRMARDFGLVQMPDGKLVDQNLKVINYKDDLVD